MDCRIAVSSTVGPMVCERILRSEVSKVRGGGSQVQHAYAQECLVPTRASSKWDGIRKVGK